MAHPLDQPFRKFVRADEHIEALHESTERWRAGDANPGVIEDDPQTGDRLLRVELRERPPVLDWAVLIGDALHNLRSGLDHLAWALGGNPPPNPKTSEFPIYIDPGKLKGKGLKAIKGIPAPARKVIVDVQPCNRWKTAGRRKRDPLWVLHQCSIEDKHRLLHLGTRFVRNAPSVPLDLGEPYVGPLEDDHVLRRWGASDPDKPECTENYRLPLFIAFDPKGPGLGRPIPDFLREVSDYIANNVLAPLTPFL